MTTLPEPASYADRVASSMFHRGLDQRHAAIKIAERDGVPLEVVIDALPDPVEELPEVAEGELTVENIVERLRSASKATEAERDSADCYHILSDAIWSIIDEYDKSAPSSVLGEHYDGETWDART
jgi:hypothetical protein